MKKNPTLLVDYYKVGHFAMQPAGVNTVYSTWTARSNKYHEGCPETVVFGHQAFVQEYFVDYFNDKFFNQPLSAIRADFEKKIKNTFNPIYADFDRFEKLHKLGYLPICVMSVPEGTVLPIRVPQCAIWNTHPDFGWLPQYLEDIWSCHNYLPSTSATTAYYRRKDLEPFFEATCDDPSKIKMICGDFSFRGMTHEDAAYASSAGHCLSFDRTATVDANGFLEEFYGADIENNPPAFGTPSLEHSVVCQGIARYTNLYLTGKLDAEYQAVAERANADWDDKLIGEMLFLYHLLTKIQPAGVLSYVSDTNDYWGVIGKVAPALKPEIMARKGKLVFRPDSGTPQKIVLGDPNAKDHLVRIGSIRALHSEFGGTVNSKGFIVFDSHIGLIYGDAITRIIAIEIAQGLKDLGFSIENITFGIGAYTYQYVTRDTRGYAIKATNAIFDDLGEIALSKNPKTDDGTKVSQHGAVIVYKDYDEDGWEIKYSDGHTIQDAERAGSQLMRPIFIDGKVLNTETIYEIRDRLHNGRF